MYLYAMEETALIPMQEEQKQQLRRAYRKPLFRNAISSAIVMILLLIFILYAGRKDPSSATAVNGERTGFLSEGEEVAISISFLATYLLFFGYLFRYKRYYYKDYKFGYVVKEYVSITRVFDTPSGINIYWLSSDAIKTFTPDPYRYFRQGDRVAIYYLKHAKEYLAYET